MEPMNNTSYKGKICNKYTCSTNNLIYLIQSNQCSKSKQPTDCKYTGQTGRTLRGRFREHRRDITDNQHDKSSVAEHFNRPNHSLADVTVVPLENIVIDEKSFHEHGDNNLSLTLFRLGGPAPLWGFCLAVLKRFAVS